MISLTGCLPCLAASAVDEFVNLVLFATGDLDGEDSISADSLEYELLAFLVPFFFLDEKFFFFVSWGLRDFDFDLDLDFDFDLDFELRFAGAPGPTSQDGKVMFKTLFYGPVVPSQTSIWVKLFLFGSIAFVELRAGPLGLLKSSINFVSVN